MGAIAGSVFLKNIAKILHGWRIQNGRGGEGSKSGAKAKGELFRIGLIIASAKSNEEYDLPEIYMNLSSRMKAT